MIRRTAAIIFMTPIPYTLVVLPEAAEDSDEAVEDHPYEAAEALPERTGRERVERIVFVPVEVRSEGGRYVEAEPRRDAKLAHRTVTAADPDCSLGEAARGSETRREAVALAVLLPEEAG